MTNTKHEKLTVSETSVKTDNSERETYLDGFLLEKLRERKKNTIYNNDNDFIFCEEL